MFGIPVIKVKEFSCDICNNTFYEIKDKNNNKIVTKITGTDNLYLCEKHLNQLKQLVV